MKTSYSNLDYSMPKIQTSFTPKPKLTNADHIRAMSDEELAQLIDGIERSTVEMWHGFCDICDAKECWRCTLQWLMQEVTT